MLWYGHRLSSLSLIRHREALACMLWSLDLIHQCHGIILGGDAAHAVLVFHQLVAAGTILSGALAWRDEVRRAEIRPLQVSGTVDIQRVAVRLRDWAPSRIK